MSVSDPSNSPAVETVISSEVQDRVFSVPMLCIIAFAIGIVAAAGAVVFRYLISLVHNLFYYGTISAVYDANQFDAPSPLGALVILVPVVGGLIVGLLKFVLVDVVTWTILLVFGLYAWLRLPSWLGWIGTEAMTQRLLVAFGMQVEVLQP